MCTCMLIHVHAGRWPKRHHLRECINVHVSYAVLRWTLPENRHTNTYDDACLLESTVVVDFADSHDGMHFVCLCARSGRALADVPGDLQLRVNMDSCMPTCMHKALFAHSDSVNPSFQVLSPSKRAIN
jgi:hypothetical protein